MAVNAIYQGWETDSQVTRYEIRFDGNGLGTPITIEAPPGVFVQDAGLGAGEYIITLPTPVTSPQIGSSLEFASIQVSAQASAGTDAAAQVVSFDEGTRSFIVQYKEAGIGTDNAAGEWVHVSVTTKHSLASQ